MKKYLLTVLVCLSSLLLNAQVYDMIVDAGGSGDYQTIQEAINAVPDNSSIRTRIFISNGTYNEKVELASSKKNVSLIGESVDGVIISWDDEAGSGSMSTAETYTFWADGEDCYIENITIENTAGDVGQAVALRTTGDKTILNNCKLTGFQDTFYAHKNRQYIYKTFINGATDFIFGDATAGFDSCIIECLSGGSFISAPADTKLVSTPTGEDGNRFTLYHGLQFRNCDIVAGSGVADNSYYLARPWQPNASSVFINCNMGNHIKPIGWSTWDSDNHLSGFYGEYHSIDFEGNDIDISQRADWSNQISDYNYNKFYGLRSDLENGISNAVFFRNVAYYPNGDYYWTPYDTLKALNPPVGFGSNGKTISWSAVENAIGYAIYREGVKVGYSETNSFTDEDAETHTQYNYTVRTIKNTGGMSGHSDIYTTTLYPTSIEKVNTSKIIITVSGDILTVSEPAVVSIYSITGQLYKTENAVSGIDVGAYKRGIYLVKAMTNTNKTSVTRVVL